VSAATYYIDGVEYSSVEQTVSLDAANATLDRIDVVALDDTGTVVAVTGTAAAQPSEPGIDSGSQLKLAIVSVPANTTEPPDISSFVVFAEHAGSPTEWDWSTSGTGFSVTSTNNPRTGTITIEGTNVASNAYAQALIGSGSLTASSADRLVFFIRSKATWANKRVLKVQLQSSGVLVGNVITISTGAYGFSSSVTASYQQVVIPLVQFAVPASATFNQLRFTDSGGAIGFYIDDVSFQGGTGQVQTVAGLTQDQADARYPLRSNNLLDVASTSTARTNLGLGTASTPQFARLGVGAAADSNAVAYFNGQYGGAEYNAGNSSTALTVNWNNGNQQRMVLTDNVILTLSNPIAGYRYLLVLTQDGVGGRTVTWPNSVKWSSGTAAVLTTTAGATDICTFAYSAVGSGIYFAACNLDIR
jgi:hypothetical protein